MSLRWYQDVHVQDGDYHNSTLAALPKQQLAPPIEEQRARAHELQINRLDLHVHILAPT